MVAKRFVFQDSLGKRWRRIRGLSLILALTFFVLFLLFVRALFIRPILHPPQSLETQTVRLKNIESKHETPHLSPSPPSWLHSSKKKNPGATRQKSETITGRGIALAYYVNWDARSFESLKTHKQYLTHLSPEWFFLSGLPPTLSTKVDQKVVELAESNDIKLVPLLSNVSGDEFVPEPVEELARKSPEEQALFFEQVIKALKELGASGVNIDWEQVDPAYRDDISNLLITFAKALQAENLELWLSIPLGNDIKVFDLEKLAPVVDHFVAQIFDETGENDAPGPIASQPWVSEWLDVLLEHGEPSQWVIAFGTFGYDWSEENSKAKASAEQISFAEAMSRAALSSGTLVKIESPLYQPHFSYSDESSQHNIWFQDAITFRNQLSLLSDKQVAGVALYRLGGEDPSVWDLLSNPQREPQKFFNMPSTHELTHFGKGDILFLKQDLRSGLRNISIDNKGLWQAQYLSFPSNPLVLHRGAEHPKQVALSFDDGPDPKWTPLILDILRRENVKASFFIVGEKAAEYPEIVRRMVAEGHAVGNHSYSHSDLTTVTAPRLALELNATQRLISGISGRSSILFRPPYHADSRLESYAEFLPLLEAQQLGYTVITEGIDSEDWKVEGPEQILRNVQERRDYGNIILLHDAGGNRRDTVEALSGIIHFLRARGDEIVPLNDLLSLPSSALMPPVAADNSQSTQLIAQSGLEALQIIEEASWVFLLASTVLLTLRAFLVLFLALRQKRKEEHLRSQKLETSPQAVSIIIAAFNEEKVIKQTLLSIFNTKYAGEMEVVLVNDGSADETVAEALSVAKTEPRLKVITQERSGKSLALERALKESSHEFVLMLDADTQFNQETIGELVRALETDAEAGAVAGHIRVGNLGNWCARFQSLEYICGFNLDRRAYDYWNCITVVPGAVSAYRRSAILNSGGISHETQAEDTDLTLCLHRAGYRVRYASKAVAFTEAPESVGALLKQRTRWAFGTLQCLWKHRDLLFNPEYRALAYFSLPTVWFCHIFLVALAPMVDILLLCSLLVGAASSLWAYAIMFLLIDCFLAYAACRMEGENTRSALLIIPMRLLYRPLLCYAVWSALIRALKGAWYGWGKLERKGSVQHNLLPH